MTTSSQSGALRLTGLGKHFGSVRAVDGIDLSISAGEIVAILGPNGAGKTTMIDLILGLSHPSAGQISVFGTSPAQAIAAGRIAAVLQTGGLLRDITARESVELTAALFGSHIRIDDVLRRSGVGEFADRRVGKCSGGQQQRIRFAMALVSDPDLLLLDEPTTGMDVAGRRDFWSAIRADAASGRTILFATHYLDEADAYADRIVLLAHGRVVADGSSAEIKNLATGHMVSAAFGTAEAAIATGNRILTAQLADTAEVRGTRLILHTASSDALARHLLTQTEASELEITARSLEDAFVRLTSTTDDDGAPANDDAASACADEPAAEDDPTLAASPAPTERPTTPISTTTGASR